MNYSVENDAKIEVDRTLIIGCGALAGEIIALKKLNGWSHIDLKCLDAALHTALRNSLWGNSIFA